MIYKDRMKKVIKYLIILFLITFFVVLLKSYVTVGYNVSFQQGDITTVSLALFPINPQQRRLSVHFPARYNNQLKNIDYIEGWVKIGNELFTLNKDEIRIFLQTAKSPSDRFVTILYEEYGKIVLSEEEKLYYLHDTFHIVIRNDKNILFLNKLYKQENRNIELYFKYMVTVGYEVIEMIIIENLIYEIERRIYFLGKFRLN